MRDVQRRAGLDLVGGGLFDDGARIGPELTGAQRTNSTYLLTKLLDPNAVVGREFQVTLVVTKDGRAINGLVREETEKVLAVQTPTELIRLPTLSLYQATSWFPTMPSAAPAMPAATWVVCP